ncbi:MAG: OmpA family protein [Chloroherpetonaceae bacterium]
MTNFTKKLSASIFAVLLSVLLFNTLNAQETKFRDQAWRYGLLGGVQNNSASLGWQTIHNNDFNFHSPADDIKGVDGTGIGFYGGIVGAYLSDSWWGIGFRIAYDQRNALIEDDSRTPIPSFDTKIDYISFAPSFIIDPKIIPNLSLNLGFIINTNLSASYIYKPDKDLSYSEPSIDISRFNSIAYGFQGGFAYDIKVADLNPKSSMYISPFFDMSWLVNQRKGENEPTQNSFNDVWSTLSYRVGVQITLDYRKDAVSTTENLPPAATKNNVSVSLPQDNVILTKDVQGYFPIIPYVFFDRNSQEIPSRYTKLSIADARNFKESDLENFIKGELTTRETNVDQLMTVYYNILNIYGDRMRNNPNTTVTLRCSDPEARQAISSGEAIKRYLVENYGIDEDRIRIVEDPPFIPSGSEFTDPAAAGLIADENRRVTFSSNDQELLKPVKYTIRDESSIDNDMIFSVNRNVNFKSWDITITGEGRTMYFGPFTSSYQRINPAEIMRFLESGKYNAKVEITDMNGRKTSENLKFNLHKEKEIRNATRYLMLFDYGSSGSIASYETVIRKEIVPGIETNQRVIVHGHTDNIGTEAGNQTLSQNRADQAKTIIDDQLQRENRKANVQAIGVGQSRTQYSFNNTYPEGRMYNRNVFVEIMK